VIPTVLEVPAVLRSLPLLTGCVRALAQDQGFPPRAVDEIDLALEEIFTNILNHGYPPGSPAQVKVRILPSPEEFRMEFYDYAKAFDFKAASTRYQGRPEPRRAPGGVGLFLVMRVMDQVIYEPASEGGNRMVLVKRRPA
jgi:serine/threonine-protein kinase RsbW